MNVAAIALGLGIGDGFVLGVMYRVRDYHLIRAGYWAGKHDLLEAAEGGEETLHAEFERDHARWDAEDSVTLWQRIRIGGKL